jgi:tyrosinase
MAAKKAKATKSRSGAPGDNAPYRIARLYKSPKKISIADLPAQFTRADLEFIRVEHSGASYEARVFINNPDADGNTPPVEANGYAGSFSIFGHGGCFGDVGHCDIHKGEQDPFDPRPSHPLLPIKKVIIATNAIRSAVTRRADISVTVVPVVMGWTEQSETDDVLKFDHINLVTYD